MELQVPQGCSEEQGQSQKENSKVQGIRVEPTFHTEAANAHLSWPAWGDSCITCAANPNPLCGSETFSQKINVIPGASLGGGGDSRHSCIHSATVPGPLLGGVLGVMCTVWSCV